MVVIIKALGKKMYNTNGDVMPSNKGKSEKQFTSKKIDLQVNRKCYTK